MIDAGDLATLEAIIFGVEKALCILPCIAHAQDKMSKDWECGRGGLGQA